MRNLRKAPRLESLGNRLLFFQLLCLDTETGPAQAQRSYPSRSLSTSLPEILLTPPLEKEENDEWRSVLELALQLSSSPFTKGS
ncbi:MAG: hypothetical protein WBD99_05565 [Thermodesulfobacteriota bacterium]